jgi:uncharacterized membrane protein
MIDNKKPREKREKMNRKKSLGYRIGAIIIVSVIIISVLSTYVFAAFY